MWFKRKSGNRRLGRGHVLDVKLRSGLVRAARVRMVAIGFGVCFGTVFGLYLAWRTGEWVLNRFVYENRAFAIHKIEVQTDGVVGLDQLRRWSGVATGQNLLALDLGKVKRDLELAPVVDSASVERILPHTLCIRVAEREPVAQVLVPRRRADGGVEAAMCQLDAAGYVLLPLSPKQRNPALPAPAEQFPSIVGVNPIDLQPGRRLDSPQVQAALGFISAFEQSPMAGLVDVKRIDISAPEVLVVTTSQGSEITFGTQDFETQLRRWHEVFDAAQRMNKAIATLDLAITNNIPARWLEASAVPPATPRIGKPLRTKKKHV